MIQTGGPSRSVLIEGGGGVSRTTPSMQTTFRSLAGTQGEDPPPTKHRLGDGQGPEKQAHTRTGGAAGGWGGWVWKLARMSAWSVPKHIS